MLKQKKVYLSDEMIADITDIIKDTGQSFSDYVRAVLEQRSIAQYKLPSEYLEEHNDRIGYLVTTIHSYILKISEIDGNKDYLPDLLEIQVQLQVLIDMEREILECILHENGGFFCGNNQLYTV